LARRSVQLHYFYEAIREKSNGKSENLPAFDVSPFTSHEFNV